MKILLTKQNVDENKFSVISLENDNNYNLKLLDYGAAILELLIPDKNGVFENIVLTYDRLVDYVNCSSYFGMICGRTSGRIKAGEFEIGGFKYFLDKNNNGINNIHGGAKGLSFRCWDFELIEARDYIGVNFHTESCDGEGGYPGNVKVEVEYILNNNNEIIITYRGTTDKATPLNLTNHAYFNLSGNYKRSILDEELYMAADKYIEVDENLIGINIENVKNTSMDFTLPKLIGRDISDPYLLEHSTKGYDHPWILNNKVDASSQIILKDYISGRSLGIETSYPTVVVYTYNYPKNEILKGGSYGKINYGICFETQYEPNGINHKEMNSAILYPGEKYYNTTKYKLNFL